ncbi:MAG: hypothetical protein AAFQ92_28500 [Bacteroidota bacterium]
MEQDPLANQKKVGQKVFEDVVARDINATIHQEVNNFNERKDESSQRVGTHLQELEKELNKKFQEKLDAISRLVEELRESLYRQIQIAPSQDKEKIDSLFSQLEDLAGKEADFEQIKAKRAYYNRAEEWLDRNVEWLVQYASTEIFTKRNPPKVKKYNLKNSSPAQARELFEKDIRTCLNWIRLHIATKTVPKKSTRAPINLVIHSDSYKDAFSKIKCALAESAQEEIPIESVQVLIRYLNRFLIQADLD